MTTPVTHERPVRIPADRIELQGMLAWPEHPSGLVLVAHGSGSGRHSPRNQQVARRLRACGMATLLFDLLSDHETDDRAHPFDIDLLADRLLTATEWAAAQPEVSGLAVGYFGASTGAAAALTAAAHQVVPVQAVVARGGRPDLAGDVLAQVTAPTLLIVGARDYPVLELNREALRRLAGEKRLVVVPRATHLFEEPGALEEAAQWAAEWFVRHLAMEPSWHRCNPLTNAHR